MSLCLSASPTMRSVSMLFSILLCLGLSSSAPPKRNSRSLEPLPYLPPGEPYLPPHTVPVAINDYIPPAEISVPIENGPTAYVATSAKTECGGVDAPDCEQAISVSVSSEPCSGNPCTVSQQITAQVPDNEGYFYPKPANPLMILPRVDEISRSLEENLPLIEEVATTLQPFAETEQVISDSERSRRGTSKLQTTPEYGPVRISTLPFNLRKTQDKYNFNKKPISRKF